MRNRFILSFIFSVLISAFSLAQKKCIVENTYNDIFSLSVLDYGGRTFLLKTVNQLDSTHCLAELVNNNSTYIDYLRVNFANNRNDNNLIAIKDSVKRKDTFVKELQNDSLFNGLMNQLVSKYNGTSGFKHDTINMDRLLNYAVKFFLIKGISEEGNYLGQVCVGINGIRLTEEDRNPHVEAFCFASVFNHYDGDKYNMQDELVKGIKEVIKVELGNNNDDRLLRAQGALFMAMRHNETLKKVLLLEYENKKDILPFVISGQ